MTDEQDNDYFRRPVPKGPTLLPPAALTDQQRLNRIKNRGRLALSAVDFDWLAGIAGRAITLADLRKCAFPCQWMTNAEPGKPRICANCGRDEP